MLQQRCLLIVCVGVLASCTRASDTQRFEPNDAPLRIVRTVPEAEATDVSPDARIDLCLNRLVDPRSVSRGDAAVASGEVRFDSVIGVELIAWRGPGGTEIPPGTDEAWCGGSVLSVTPQADLAQGVRHRMRLEPSLRGWAGESIDTDTRGWIDDEDDGVFFFLEFTVSELEAGTTGTTGTTGGGAETGTDSGGEEPAEISLQDLFDPGGVFDPARARCSCHLDDSNVANQRLDLRSAQSAFNDLVVETRERDTGFPMVTPRRPSESFLLQKLLREDGDAIFGVLGDAMPPEGPLPYPEIVSIARWIEAGAEL